MCSIHTQIAILYFHHTKWNLRIALESEAIYIYTHKYKRYKTAVEIYMWLPLQHSPSLCANGTTMCEPRMYPAHSMCTWVEKDKEEAAEERQMDDPAGQTRLRLSATCRALHLTSVATSSHTLERCCVDLASWQD